VIPRIFLAIIVVLVLSHLGLIDMGGLPWDSVEFRVSAATVMVYLLWSFLESKRGKDAIDAAYIAFLIVLLVSAADGFLLEVTVFGGYFWIRWLGLFLFAFGGMIRLLGFRRRSAALLRRGRYLQLPGLPVALGSLAGLATALIVAASGMVRKEMIPWEGERD